MKGGVQTFFSRIFQDSSSSNNRALAVIVFKNLIRQSSVLAPYPLPRPKNYRRSAIEYSSETNTRTFLKDQTSQISYSCEWEVYQNILSVAIDVPRFIEGKYSCQLPFVKPTSGQTPWTLANRATMLKQQFLLRCLLECILWQNLWDIIVRILADSPTGHRVINKRR